MTHGQAGAVCPQCGSAADVHSVEELAAMARTRLGQYQGYPPPSPPEYQAPPGSFPPPPSTGFPSAPLSPDFPSPSLPPPPPPDYSGPPPPGYTGQQSPSRRYSGGESSRSGDSFGDDIADAVLDAATRFVGRAIGRRMKKAYTERVMPAVAAKREAMLREQIAIAERHPDLRACLNDNVIFLVGGSRVLPMPNISGAITVEQADALVAQLQGG